ncbi:hypothetical protein P9112_005874 [Eukaryota sp. TZLM1-RC]
MLFHLKSFDQDICLFEMPAASTVEDVLQCSCKYINLKQTVADILTNTNDLITHGVHRPPEEYQIDEETLSKEDIAALHNASTFTYNPDPSGKRCGFALLDSEAERLKEALANLEESVCLSKIKKRAPLDEQQVMQALLELKQSLSRVFSDGLPDCDPLFGFLDCDEAFLDSIISTDRTVDNSALWWASKRLDPSKIVSSYMGGNEKTKVLVKLSSKEGGAPPSEKAVDAETEKRLMHFYYKKQEEYKRITNADDGFSSLNSEWADPKALKTSLNGLDSIRFI